LVGVEKEIALAEASSIEVNHRAGRATTPGAAELR